MSVFLEKNSKILEKESWFGRALNKEEIENFINKYFTICWQHWFRLQIPFLVRHRTFFGDLETWNVWGSIGISQFADYSKQVKNRIQHKIKPKVDVGVPECEKLNSGAPQARTLIWVHHKSQKVNLGTPDLHLGRTRRTQFRRAMLTAD